MEKFSLATAMSIEDSLKKVLDEENVRSTFFIYVKNGEVAAIDSDVLSDITDINEFLDMVPKALYEKLQSFFTSKKGIIVHE